jgi:hypothetical protein
VIFGGDPSHWSLTEEEKTRAKRFVTAVRSETGTLLMRRRRQQTF